MPCLGLSLDVAGAEAMPADRMMLSRLSATFGVLAACSAFAFGRPALMKVSTGLLLGVTILDEGPGEGAPGLSVTMGESSQQGRAILSTEGYADLECTAPETRFTSRRRCVRVYRKSAFDEVEGVNPRNKEVAVVRGCGACRVTRCSIVWASGSITSSDHRSTVAPSAVRLVLLSPSRNNICTREERALHAAVIQHIHTHVRALLLRSTPQHHQSLSLGMASRNRTA